MRLFSSKDAKLFILHSMGLVHDEGAGWNLYTGYDNLRAVST